MKLLASLVATLLASAASDSAPPADTAKALICQTTQMVGVASTVAGWVPHEFDERPSYTVAETAPPATASPDTKYYVLGIRNQPEFSMTCRRYLDGGTVQDRLYCGAGSNTFLINIRTLRFIRLVISSYLDGRDEGHPLNWLAIGTCEETDEPVQVRKPDAGCRDDTPACG